MLTCQWCGATGPLEDFKLDEANHDGFWCPDGDGHTYYDEERNKRRRILLLLESQEGVAAPSPLPLPKLHKRLSPLRYPGGKSKIADYLAAQFHAEQLDTFVEAFAGGASVGLALLDAGLIKQLVLNDTDPGVYSFWNTIIANPDILLERLRTITPTRKLYWEAKAILESLEAHAEPEMAWAMLLCNRLSYSGIIKANPLGGKNGSDEDLLVRWNPEALAKRIERIHGLRDHIAVTNMDCCSLIEMYAYWDDKTTLFVDPPYVKKGKQLYAHYFTEDDHRRLAFLLENLYQGMPGADIVITYDDCELIRDIYPLAEIATINRYYSI